MANIHRILIVFIAVDYLVAYPYKGKIEIKGHCRNYFKKKMTLEFNLTNKSSSLYQITLLFELNIIANERFIALNSQEASSTSNKLW